MKKKSDASQRTMDLLILKTLALAPMHGYGISRRLEQITNGVFQINAGTLFPALYRLIDSLILAIGPGSTIAFRVLAGNLNYTFGGAPAILPMYRGILPQLVLNRVGGPWLSTAIYFVRFR